MKITNGVSLLVIGLSLVAIAAARAQDGAPSRPIGAQPEVSRPSQAPLSRDDVADRLTRQGYGSIGEIEFEKGLYEVKLRGERGRRTIYVDPVTGEVVRTKRDD